LSARTAASAALAESLVDSFKTERIRDRVWRAPSQLELVEYIAWFNNERLHTSLGGLPPAGYERAHARR
jgi:putative transposase